MRNRYDLNKNKKLLSLNINNRKTQKELRKDWLLEIENERRSGLGLNVFLTYSEMEEFNDNEDDFNNNMINLKNDYQLIESTNIINDFLDIENKNIFSLVK